MTNEELVKALRGIEKTMFALGTAPINMDSVSIKLAYDEKWGQTATDAADAIESLQKELDAADYQLKMHSMCPFDDEEEE